MLHSVTLDRSFSLQSAIHTVKRTHRFIACWPTATSHNSPRVPTAYGSEKDWLSVESGLEPNLALRRNIIQWLCHFMVPSENGCKSTSSPDNRIVSRPSFQRACRLGRHQGTRLGKVILLWYSGSFYPRALRPRRLHHRLVSQYRYTQNQVVAHAKATNTRTGLAPYIVTSTGLSPLHFRTPRKRDTQQPTSRMQVERQSYNALTCRALTAQALLLYE